MAEKTANKVSTPAKWGKENGNTVFKMDISPYLFHRIAMLYLDV